MRSQDFTTSFLVDQTPEEAVAAITDVRGWWSGAQTKVTFAHLGLTPEFECFDQCSNAWGFYINGSLRSLITSGRGDPKPKA